MTQGVVADRCEMVAFDKDGQPRMRCTLDRRHYSLRNQAFGFRISDGCHFEAVAHQALCGRTSVNFSMRTIRTCGRIEEHDGECIYFWFTEREATREEMRLPEWEK